MAKNPRVLICLQARMESTRFPGKVLAPLLGKPMLLHQLDRVAQRVPPHELVVACPNTPPNQAIRDLCTAHGYHCLLIPGDPNDLLARFYAVAHIYDIEAIVRISGDCPLLDVSILDLLIQCYFDHPGIDFVGLSPDWPEGQDCEMFSVDALARAQKMALWPSEREHLGSCFYRHPEAFSVLNMPCLAEAGWQSYSVDTPADLALVATILHRALDAGYGLDLSWRDLMALCNHPDIQEQMAQRPINQAYVDQVAAERGVQQDWQTIRYKKE